MGVGHVRRPGSSVGRVRLPTAGCLLHAGAHPALENSAPIFGNPFYHLGAGFPYHETVPIDQPDEGIRVGFNQLDEVCVQGKLASVQSGYSYHGSSPCSFWPGCRSRGAVCGLRMGRDGAGSGLPATANSSGVAPLYLQGKGMFIPGQYFRCKGCVTTGIGWHATRRGVNKTGQS